MFNDFPRKLLRIRDYEITLLHLYVHRSEQPFKDIECFCKHQEDILVITLWLANVGCGHFCRISSETVCIETDVIIHNDLSYVFDNVRHLISPLVA